MLFLCRLRRSKWWWCWSSSARSQESGCQVPVVGVSVSLENKSLRGANGAPWIYYHCPAAESPVLQFLWRRHSKRITRIADIELRAQWLSYRRRRCPDGINRPAEHSCPSNLPEPSVRMKYSETFVPSAVVVVAAAVVSAQKD